MVKKYDPSDPTQRVDDWGPTRPTKILDDRNRTGDLGVESDETVFLNDVEEASSDKENPPEQKDANGQVNFMHNPVVGWLVIIKGPGRGASLRLGSGKNTIGRGPKNRIRLDYGDKRISRDRHCSVTFEPKARKFYVQDEDGQNLTYLNDTVVLRPDELPSGSVVTIGDTDLRFVPFCNEDFGWDTAPV